MKQTPDSINLQWHGPFSIIEGTGLPNLLTSEADFVRHPGVYLWTILVDGVDLVHYVGKAEVSLQSRAKTEFRPKEAKHGWIPDTEKLRRGIKEWVYSPKTVRKPNDESWEKNPDYFIECWNRYLPLLRVYVCPMPENRDRIRDVETSLMWAVWDHEDVHWGNDNHGDYFLTNGSPVPKRVSTPLKLQNSTPTTIRGIG